jgi:hypothetical protein
MEKIIWGIDPGSAVCGICELRSGLIGHCFECEPKDVYNRIMSLSGASEIIVVIEDIFPYSLRLTPAVIDTCKLIGELTYRFKQNTQVEILSLVARNTIKNWVFDTVPEECIPRINKKILLKNNRNIRDGKKSLVKKDGEMRQPSFQWVDDRIVIAAMKSIHNIPTPKPGKPNIYGLKSTSHSWQALAVASFFRYNNQ